MISHALKLIWNRRRANRLVVVEIAAAFVVTFVLAALAANLWSNYRRPLGFEYENIWSVTATETTASELALMRPGVSHSETLADVLAALRALPRTEAVEPIQATPFTGAAWQRPYAAEGDGQIMVRINRTTAGGLHMLGVTLIDGRFFGPEDEGQGYRAVLVNRTFVEQVFRPGQEVVGRRIDRAFLSFPGVQSTEEEVEQWRQGLREERIVGVIDDFRQHGEFAAPQPYVIDRHEPADEQGLSFSLMLEVAPGTDAGFEETIVMTIESVAPGWVAEIAPWEQLREIRHRWTLLPLKVATTLAAFFIALVVMGLIGVLWQDVVRRTQEIGLRRALGAGAGAVRRQIQLEMLVLGGFGILIGAAIAIQFPLLELVERIDWASTLPGLALAAALILALVALGALYPSWLASRREPADALRYE